MNILKSNIRSFFFQSKMSFKALFSYLDPLAYILLKILVPILQIIFFSLLSQYAFKTNDIAPWIIGNSILLCSKNAIYGVGRVLINERMFGTLKLIIASPCNKFLVFVGRGFMHIFDALITVSIGLLIGFLFFNLRIPFSNMILFTIIISLYSAMAIGQLISCVGLVYRDIHMLLNISEYLLIILTGASFPISRLPIFLQNISNFLPLTRGIKAARLLTTDYNLSEILNLLTVEFLIGTIYLISAYFMLTYFEYLSRKKATLDLY